MRCWRQPRREGSGGVVADVAKLSVGREAYYTRELATDHEQYLSRHGESRHGGTALEHPLVDSGAAVTQVVCPGRRWARQ